MSALMFLMLLQLIFVISGNQLQQVPNAMCIACTDTYAQCVVATINVNPAGICTCLNSCTACMAAKCDAFYYNTFQTATCVPYKTICPNLACALLPATPSAPSPSIPLAPVNEAQVTCSTKCSNITTQCLTQQNSPCVCSQLYVNCLGTTCPSIFSSAFQPDCLNQLKPVCPDLDCSGTPKATPTNPPRPTTPTSRPPTTPTTPAPTSSDVVPGETRAPTKGATCSEATDCGKCLEVSTRTTTGCRWCENGDGCQTKGTTCTARSADLFAFPFTTRCTSSISDIKALADLGRAAAVVDYFNPLLVKNFPNLPIGTLIQQIALTSAANAIDFALSVATPTEKAAALNDICEVAKKLLSVGFGIQEISRIQCTKSVKRDSDATTTVSGTVSDFAPSSSSLSGGAIAGIVIGVLIGVAVIAVIGFLLVSKKDDSSSYSDYSSL